eukprot:591452_1
MPWKLQKMMIKTNTHSKMTVDGALARYKARFHKIHLTISAANDVMNDKPNDILLIEDNDVMNDKPNDMARLNAPSQVPSIPQPHISAAEINRSKQIQTSQQRFHHFHESASAELVEDCNRLNRCDVDGPQQVKVIEFTNGWQLIESLSGGQPYYHHPKSDGFPRAVSTTSVPKDCIEKPKVRTVRHQDQGSAFVKPPHPSLYSKSLGSTPIVTNAYSVSGSFLSNTINTYLV